MKHETRQNQVRLRLKKHIEKNEFSMYMAGQLSGIPYQTLNNCLRKDFSTSAPVLDRIETWIEKS